MTKIGDQEEIVQQLLRLLKSDPSSPSLAQLLQEAGSTINEMYHSLGQRMDNAYQTIADQFKPFLNGSKLQIEVERHKLRSATRGALIPAKAKFQCRYTARPTEIDCYIACGHWEKLGELKKSTINIIDYLDKLLPNTSYRTSKKGPIGLVTFQNGMMNHFETDF